MLVATKNPPQEVALETAANSGPITVDVQDSSAILTRLFERFSESSSKLEEKYAALTREVDELKDQLRDKEEEIKRSERLAMLGETAAALAHEVRNPLGAVTLFLSMLRTDVADRPQAVALVDEIERSVTSLNNVVSNVLHFAKNNRLRLAPINVHSVLMELVQHFENLYGSNITIESSLDGSPFILGDDQTLRQAVYNLMMNSLQATSFSTRLSLQCSETKSPDGVSIIVSDCGPGISPEVLPRLFEPFVSGRRDGTGLGLSIVKRIVEAHGGTISATNDAGAKFTIWLPRRAKDTSVASEENV
jgi:signal transduction histidine kinase